MKKINITNPNKILFENSKITKLDVVNYYLDISPKMLPFVENRVLSVVRCHDGITDCFFKKHPQKTDSVQRVNQGGQTYFYITNVFELIAQIQNGSLELHTQPHSVQRGEPSIMVFDLDPDTDLPHKNLCESIRLVKSVLDELNLKSFLKTSGGKGYHICVPFAQMPPEKFKDTAKNIALIAESKWPKMFTTNIKKSARKGKIFVDYLRNGEASTCVCPFSLRARENAPISFPISWENLEKIKPNQITIKNYKKYLNNSWQDFFK